MSELQENLKNDKYAKNNMNKTLWDVYQDNLKELNNEHYLNILLKYIPYFKRSTLREIYMN